MKHQNIKEIFGTYLFDRKKMKEKLPPNVWKKLDDAMGGRETLDIAAADVIASAMKDWAVSMGATHWAHWFHPLNGVTAEKCNAFINVNGDGISFDSFNGRNLIQSESDASSFPSGGIRSTFEARGYCAWDVSSPAFIMSTPKGGTLCIPSVFLSYDGTPLDTKSALLKSLDALEGGVVKLLHLLGNDSVKSAHVTVGIEQEFFLVDTNLYKTRPDLRFCHRTLVGSRFPKDQTSEAHYFASIPPKIMAYMEDAERDLARLGVIIEAKHNEVAPGQYEFCTKFTNANLACDQNQLLMDVMKKVAVRHNLELLLHEKPFAGVNGSGKHTNISLSDELGTNLLQLHDTFEKNIVPLSFISALTLGVSAYQSLLNTIVAIPGNMLRMGAHEAPPNIISVYLGEALDSLFKSASEGGKSNIIGKIYSNFGIKKLPDLLTYDNDRNRTSPLAFTGNKFEFRAPGSSQAVAGPTTILTAVWAWGIDKIIGKIESHRGKGLNAYDSALKAISEAYAEGSRVCFEGDAYSKSWHEEAKKRNLAIPQNILEAIDYIIDQKNMDMLTASHIFTKEELEASRTIRLMDLCHTLATETVVLRGMMFNDMLPAISKQIILESDTLKCLSDIDFADAELLRKAIHKLGEIKASIIHAINKLDECDGKIDSAKSLEEKARVLVNEAIPIMNEIRKQSDKAESLVDKSNVSFASYSELLSI